MVTVSVDGSVLDRIAKIMTYLRLGSSGKVLKKKKKEKDVKGDDSFSNYCHKFAGINVSRYIYHYFCVLFGNHECTLLKFLFKKSQYLLQICG